MAKAEDRIVIKKEGETGQIHVSVTEYKGVKYIDIRNYYRDPETGDHKPTPKGISVPTHLIKKVLKACRKLGEPFFDEEPPDPKELKEKRRAAREDELEINKKSKTKTKKAKKEDVEYTDFKEVRPRKTIDDEDRPTTVKKAKRDPDFPAKLEKKKKKKTTL